MAGKKSRDKGAAGERELARWLTERGHPAKRGQQRSGLEQSDVICDSLGSWWIECKRAERLRIYTSMEQARRDAARAGRTPVVFHRQNKQEWLVILRASDFIDLLEKETGNAELPAPQPQDGGGTDREGGVA